MDTEKLRQLMKTPLDQWCDRYKYDDLAKDFEPTAEEPVFKTTTRMLELDQTVTIYGVKYRRQGISGNRTVPIYGFDWFLDQDEAKREALFRMWLVTDEAWKQYQRQPPCDLRQKITTVAETQIGEVAGEPLLAYRVWRYAYAGWELTRSFGRVREIWAENLWCVIGEPHSRDLVKTPSLEDDSPIPEVYAFHYADYPDTGEPMYRYGTVCVENAFDATIIWFTDRAEAQVQLDKSMALIQRVRKELRDREEHETAERLFVQAWTAANDLSCKNRRLNIFRGCIEPTLVAKFEETYQDNSGLDHRELDLETLLDGAAQLETVTAELGQALEAEYQKRLAFIAEHEVVSTLNKLLSRHLALCPICTQPFERGQEWMTELLVYGEAYLHCDHGCPETGYDKYERATCQSRIIREVFDGQMEYSKSLPKVAFTGDQGYEHPAVALYRIDSDNETLLQLVLDTCNARLRPALTVDLERLAKATNGTPTSTTDLWTHIAARSAEERQGRAEESVRKGESVKLQFRWDERRGRWSAKLREGQRLTVWTVDDPYVEGINSSATYYCRVIRTPERIITPTFTLHIVQPYLLAKRTNSNRSDRHAD